MRYISEALDQYSGICKEALHDCASKLSKSFESVIIEVLLLYMVIPGKINFTGPLRQALRTVLPPELRAASLEEPELAALQRRFRLAQRGKGHDEGTGNGIFHVQVQTTDDQHVHGQANF